MRVGTPTVGILGAVTVHGPNGTVSPAGVLPRGLLAVLALEAPRPVSLDRLTALLWSAEPPNGVKAAIQQLVTRVRRSLASVGIEDSIRFVAPGYQLAIDPDTIDLRMFRRGVRGAAALQGTGDAAGTARELGHALDLWRGNALDDLTSLPLYSLLAPTLDDERARAEEVRCEALLAMGRQADAAGYLAAATARYPLDERLWALHTRALLLDGRTSEAGRVLRAGIAVITASLGVPPPPRLLELERTLSAPPDRADRRSRPSARDTDTPPRSERMPALLHSALSAALDRAEAAARAAIERRAYDEAVRQWQRALDLLDSIDTNDDRTRLRLLLGLGDTHNRVSLESEAQWAFSAARDAARRLGDSVGLAEAALGYCADRIGFATPLEQAGLLNEALAALPDDAHRLRSRLLARLATEVYWQGSPDTTLGLAHAAIDHARTAGDPDAELWARYALAYGCWTPARTPQLRDVCVEYLAESLRVGDRFHEMMARRWLAQATAELGDVAAGLREAGAAVELADDLDNAAQRWMNRTISATLHILAGDLDTAETLAGEALAIGSLIEPQTSLDYVGMVIWNIHWLRNDLGAIVELVDEVASRDGVQAARRLGLALTYSSIGRFDTARALMGSIETDDLLAIPRDASWYFALAALAETAADTGDRGRAALALDALLPYRDRIAINSLTTTGPVAHQAARAAWCSGDVDLAVELASQAVEISRAAGAPLFEARSRALLASLRQAVS